MGGMRYPDATEFVDVFGIEPQILSGEVGVSKVEIETGVDEFVSLAFDVVGCTIRTRWVKSGSVVYDVYREFVSHIRLDPTGGIVVTSDGSDFTSELVISLYPFGVKDILLAS
jgi:hypothetical protein